MEFKLPQIPKIVRLPQSSKISGTKQYHEDDFKQLHRVGSGSFGTVDAGIYCGRQVVIKRLMFANEKALIKEARFLNQLKHMTIGMTACHFSIPLSRLLCKKLVD